MSLETMHYEVSAGDFVERCAAMTQLWLAVQDKAGALKKYRWVAMAVLPSGATISIRRIGAEGHSLVKMEGESGDGSPCLVLAHYHSVQFLTLLVPRKPDDPPKREMGFHTGQKDIKIEN